MNSYLHQKILNKLTVLTEGDPVRKKPPKAATSDYYNNPVKVLEYIDTRVEGLEKIWQTVHKTVEKARKQSRKNAKLAEAVYLEAEFRLNQMMDEPTDTVEAKSKETKKKREEELENILDLIDEAIVNCPIEDYNFLAMMFSLRSAALSEAHNYELAMENIDRAIQMVPKEFIYQVYKVKHLVNENRLQEALRMITNLLGRCQSNEGSNIGDMLQSIQRDISKYVDSDKTRANAASDLEFTYHSEEISEDSSKEDVEPSNETEEDAQNFDFDYRCRIESSDTEGRHMVASDSIGESILILKEKFYSMVLLPELSRHKCHFCAQDVFRRFWPCNNCNVAVYCDEQCQAKDWKLSHRLECGLTKWWTDRSKSQLHVFRLLNRLGVDNVLDLDQRCDLPPYNLFTYMHDTEQQSTSEVHKDIDCKLKAYKALLSLQHHSDKHGPSSLPGHMTTAIECAMIAAMVQGYDYHSFPRDRLVDLVAHCFFGVRRVLLNSFNWSGHDHKGNKQSIAIVLCLLGSMLNHSCDFNAQWSFQDGVFYLRTTKPIEPSKEITISYGIDRSTSLEERQQVNLKYFFQCKCAACLNDARTVLALQCSFCPGPVMVNSAVFDGSKDAICLLCEQTCSDTKVKVDQMVQARQDLHTIAQLLDHCETADKTKYIAMLKQLLGQIKALIYNKSYLLVQDIFVVCKVLQREALYEECIPYGVMMDEMLPLKGRGLMALKPSDISKKSSIPFFSDLDNSFDLNIDHMILWVSGVYQAWIEKTESKSASIWNTMIRFQYRTRKVIKMVIEDKQSRLAVLPTNVDTFDTVGLKEEIELLQTLLKHKEQQYQRMKQQFAELFGDNAMQ